MNSPALLVRLGVFAALLTAAACTTTATPAPSNGPWQLLGTVFAMEGSVVGAPVAGAQLALSTGNEVKATTTTDSSGRYAFDPMQTGSFTLTISAPGFVSLTPTVRLDRDMQADFAIKRP